MELDDHYEDDGAGMMEIPIDSTGDGKIDYIGYDTTGDGNIDYVGLLDEHGTEVVRLVPIAEYLAGQEDKETTLAATVAKRAVGYDEPNEKRGEEEKVLPGESENSNEESHQHVREIPIDSSGNGTIDAIGYDTTGDGYIDYVGILDETGSEVERLVPIAEYLETHEGISSRIDQRDPAIIANSPIVAEEESPSSETPMCSKCKHRHFSSETCAVCGHTWPRGPKTLRRLSEGGHECRPVRACVSITRHSQNRLLKSVDHDASTHVEEAQSRHSILRRHSGDWSHMIAPPSPSATSSSAKGGGGRTTRAARVRASTYQNPTVPALHASSVGAPHLKLGHDDEHSCDAMSNPGKIARVSCRGDRIRRVDMYVPPPSTAVSVALSRLRSDSFKTGESVPKMSEPRRYAIRKRERPLVSVTKSSPTQIHLPHTREAILRTRRGSFVSVGSVAQHTAQRHSRLSPYVVPPSKDVHDPQRRLSIDRANEVEEDVANAPRDVRGAPRRSVWRQHDVATVGKIVKVRSGHRKIIPDRRASFTTIPSPGNLLALSRESISQYAPYLRHRAALPQPASHFDRRLRYQFHPRMNYSFAFHALLKKKKSRKKRKDRSRLPPAVPIRKGDFR